jgi:hypothetical protein
MGLDCFLRTSSEHKPPPVPTALDRETLSLMAAVGTGFMPALTGGRCVLRGKPFFGKARGFMLGPLS